MRRLSTVTETTVEKLVPGDQVRTPQGQLIRVRQFLPHETDRLSGYIKTDQGLLQVQRGMTVQMVPGGQKAPSTQQELPGPGNTSTGGNFPGLPAAGQGPGGAGPAQPGGRLSACPRCGNRSLRVSGTQVTCAQCGYHGGAQVSPIGLQPGIEHSMLQQPQKPDQAPGRHQLWSTRRPSVIAARAAEVLRYMDGD